MRKPIPRLKCRGPIEAKCARETEKVPGVLSGAYGNIKETVWENASEKGPFVATTFSQPMKVHILAKGQVFRRGSGRARIEAVRREVVLS